MGKAAWAVDEATLIKMRAKKVHVIGVFVKETEDIYIASLDNFLDRAKAKILNFEDRGGALQRYLPLEYFKYRAGAAKMT